MADMNASEGQAPEKENGDVPYAKTQDQRQFDRRTVSSESMTLTWCKETPGHLKSPHSYHPLPCTGHDQVTVIRNDCGEKMMSDAARKACISLDCSDESDPDRKQDLATSLKVNASS